jgi:uncharacterized membrane protein
MKWEGTFRYNHIIPANSRFIWGCGLSLNLLLVWMLQSHHSSTHHSFISLSFILLCTFTFSHISYLFIPCDFFFISKKKIQNIQAKPLLLRRFISKLCWFARKNM